MKITLDLTNAEAEEILGSLAFRYRQKGLNSEAKDFVYELGDKLGKAFEVPFNATLGWWQRGLTVKNKIRVVIQTIKV